MQASKLKIIISPTGSISVPSSATPTIFVSSSSDTFSPCGHDEARSRAVSEDSLYQSKTTVSVPDCLHGSLVALQKELSKAVEARNYARSQQMAISIGCIADIMTRTQTASVLKN
jgi:hypothetical protein